MSTVPSGASVLPEGASIPELKNSIREERPVVNRAQPSTKTNLLSAAVLNELETPRTLKVSFSHPVPWGDDGAEVDRCVVILVPPGHEDRHIELLAQVVKGESRR